MRSVGFLRLRKQAGSCGNHVLLSGLGSWSWLTAEPVEAGYWDLEVADDTEDTREDLQHHRTGDR